uniref:HTH arsR-type domain-containing protein n=1 Tax=Phenylobacterium glaciei TaxID=2803784 RepID=A0A974P7A6_9CAUL|nr:hypothetical protein JKL49_13105 [Phenylobacterium glaciei]
MKESLPTSGDDLLAQLSALANPHRLRIVAALHQGGRRYGASWPARSASAGRCCTCTWPSWRRRASSPASWSCRLTARR